ncbi:hypothetical protein PR202_ga08357 [Eleusine coracana subsp. coracana]|uniref:Uncharacterized protein n=1 Tax=Eleusine coracana subsp. coracana TaxID=191504 RepID=A0AAV5BZS9_ELECO|nr:hypothetical protein PR202_ga08357 [Eleusine coracana subsp. coracana]
MARTRLLLLLLGLAVLALHHAGCAVAALRSSSISAAPEYPRLPTRQHSHSHHSALSPAPAPAMSASLSPDIMPLLPSPAEDGAAAPPSDAVPTIPSSPSPPNPDALEPNSAAFAPFGYAPAVAAQSRAPPLQAPPAVGLLLLLLAMWLV